MASIEQLEDLIGHMWVHSGYENCGRRKMTREQQLLFDGVIRRQTDHDWCDNWNCELCRSRFTEEGGWRSRRPGDAAS